MKSLTAALLLLGSVVIAIGQEGSLKLLAKMSEKEAFSQILKYAGVPEAPGLDGSLEKKGWEIIESLIEEGPSIGATNRLGLMIRTVGLHPSSTNYSVDQARAVLSSVTPRIHELLQDERRVDYAKFRASDPFGGTGGQDSPDGYDRFISSLIYFNDVAEAAMNIVAVKGNVGDLEVIERIAAMDAEPFPVSFPSMAKASVDAIKKRLEGRMALQSEYKSGSKSDGNAEVEPPGNEVNQSLPSKVEPPEANGHPLINGETGEPPTFPKWALAVIIVALLTILLFLIRAFLRDRAS